MTNETSPNQHRLRDSVYRAIIEALPHVIWVTNSEGEAIFLNRAWKEWTGREVEASLGSRWTESVHPDDAPALLASWQRAYTDGAPYAGECRFVAKDGSCTHASFIGVPVRNKSGNITNWFGINLDVTNLKRTEESLQEKVRQLEIANDAMIGRELRMVELKKENRRLRALLQDRGGPDAGDQVAGR